jgi:Flp pilus assembly protein TadD
MRNPSLWLLLLPCLWAQPSIPVESTLRRTQQSQPNNFAANLALGQYLLEAGRPSQAITFLAKAVQLNPEDIPSRHDLASAYIEASRLTDARAWIEKMPTSPAKLHLEAQWLAASGQMVPAAEMFQKAAEAEASEKHVFDWGNHLLNLGATEQALKIFRYGIEHFPKSARFRVAQGVALYARSEFEEAARSVCAGVDINPADLRPLVFLGMMTDLSPDSASLVRLRLEGFATRFPSNPQAQYYYGLSLTKSDKPASAEPFLRRAQRLNPKMPEPRFELGKLYADAGRKVEAIQELKAAIALAPDLEAAHYRLGQILQRDGQTALATHHLAKYRELKAKKESRSKQAR